MSFKNDQIELGGSVYSRIESLTVQKKSKISALVYENYIFIDLRMDVA